MATRRRIKRRRNRKLYGAAKAAHLKKLRRLGKSTKPRRHVRRTRKNPTRKPAGRKVWVKGHNRKGGVHVKGHWAKKPSKASRKRNPKKGKRHWVKAYTRRDGIRVKGHYSK